MPLAKDISLKMRSWRWPALWIAAGYLAVSAAWIIASDWLAKRLEHAAAGTQWTDAVAWIQTFKGLGFVLATGIALYLIIDQALRSRLRISQQLDEARQRYELVIRGTDDGIWDWDIQKEEHYWSPRLEELLGYSDGEMNRLGVKWSDQLHPDDRQRALAALRAHLELNEQYDVEYRLRTKTGEHRWFRSRGRAVRDENGKPVRMAGALTDLHERIEARTRLRESEQRYRRIVETADEGIWVVDPGWKTTFVNRRMAEMLGYSTEEMLGHHLFEFMDDQARLDCERNMQRREEGVTEQHDFRLRRKDGSALWTVMSTNPITDDAGVFLGALAMVTDATKRREAELQARLAERRFRSTFEHAAVGIAHVSIEGRFLDVNDRLCEMLGYPRERLVGRAFTEITHPDDLTSNTRMYKDALAGVRSTYTFEKRYICGDGRALWAHLTASLVRADSGEPEYFISVIQDISARKATEADLSESRRRLEQAQQVGRIGSWVWEPREGGRLEWSPEIYRIFGVKPGEFGGTGDAFYQFLPPDDRAAVAEEMRAALAGERPYCVDHRVVRPDGSIRWVHEDAQIERDASGAPVRVVGVVQDISERAAAQRFGERQRAILEMMASGAPLERTVEAVIRMVEQESEGRAVGSVLRVDERGRMWTLSAPGLPADYSAAVDGATIGPSVGSCGTAMHLKKRVVVEDIATSPLWAAFKDKALEHGLRACWSEPILAGDGSALGSLAMYFGEIRGPSEHDISTITTAAHLAGIAMERARNEEAREHSEAAYRALLEAIPDMMFRVDRAGTYLDFHAPDPRRLMVPPPKFMGRTVRDVLPRDRAEQCMEALERMFATSETQLYEYEVRRADATLAWWEVRVVRARRDEALLLLRDVTERREAERRLRESEQRLRLLVQGAPLGVVSWNPDFTVAGWNPGAAQIFGYSEAEAIGRHARMIIPESARDGMDVVWRDLLAGRGGYRTTTQNAKKSGELVYCDWYNAPLVDDSGKIIGVASIIEDVTERKLAQQRTDFMMAELDHRVKNNLAAVISLAEQTGRGTHTYRDFIDTFMGRLRAMSRMHSILARSRWQGADLQTLVTQTLEAFGSGTFGRASVGGPEAMLLPRAAQAFAMALNELATNAVKYGALSAPSGHVAVEWTITDGAPGQRRLRLRWQESGGPAVSPPGRRGFGSELIEGAIAYELKGTARLVFEPAGVVCDIHVPYVTELESHEPGAPVSSFEHPSVNGAIDSRPPT